MSKLDEIIKEIIGSNEISKNPLIKIPSVLSEEEVKLVTRSYAIGRERLVSDLKQAMIDWVLELPEMQIVELDGRFDKGSPQYEKDFTENNLRYKIKERLERERTE